MQLADPPIGILFVLALSSIAVYGVMLAGWSSGSKYPLLGSVRASAQMVSYEAALGLSLAAVLLFAGTLSTSGIVAGQDTLGDWNLIATGFVPFVIFLIAATAELNRPPFDLVEAEQELVGGFNTEYSAFRFALFFLAEFMNTITMSAVIVTLFLGGPQPIGGLDIPLDPQRARRARLVRPQAVRVPLHVRVVPRHAAAPALRPADGPRLEGDDPAVARLVPAARRQPGRPSTTTGTWPARVAGIAVVVVGLRRRAAADARAARGSATRDRRRARRGSDVLMGYLDGFVVTIRQHRLFGGKRSPRASTPADVSPSGCAARARTRRARSADLVDDEKAPKPERLHGRHVLNRYEDGMEKCIGCELCAGVCPAKCIYVRGADNDPDNPTSPGERFGFVYEINYLRCIHCDLCVEACPTEAITESKLFEFSFTNRQDAIYTKAELVVDDDGQPQQLPWEDWREGEDADTSGVDAGDRAERRRRLRRRGRLERRARLRRAPAGAAAGTTPRHEPGRASARPSRDARDGAASSSSSRRRWCSAARSAWSLRRNPVHAALSLVLTLFGVAVHFVAQEAHFLAAVQVIVYAGAIVVLFLFVIMLLGVDRAEDLRDRADPDPAPAGGRSSASASSACSSRRSSPAATPVHCSRAAGLAVATDGDHDANIKQLADNLFSDHVFAFEFTACCSIVAVVGTVLLTRRDRRSGVATATSGDGQ